MAFDYSRLTATCAVDSPENAITLPPGAYGSDDLYADEVDRIFAAGFHCAVSRSSPRRAATTASTSSAPRWWSPATARTTSGCSRATARTGGWRCAVERARPACCNARITCGRSVWTGISPGLRR